MYEVNIVKNNLEIKRIKDILGRRGMVPVCNTWDVSSGRFDMEYTGLCVEKKKIWDMEVTFTLKGQASLEKNCLDVQIIDGVFNEFIRKRCINGWRKVSPKSGWIP